jgi:hypothetical protein
MSGFGVELKGLDDFDESLRRLSNAIPTAIGVASSTSAAFVVDSARPTVPRRSGRAASTLQTYVTGENAIAGGGEGIEYYRWLELGGAAGRHHSVVRSRSDGRYIKPAYEKRQAAIAEILENSLRQACADAGLEVD